MQRKYEVTGGCCSSGSCQGATCQRPYCNTKRNDDSDPGETPWGWMIGIGVVVSVVSFNKLKKCREEQLILDRAMGRRGGGTEMVRS